MVCGNKCGLIDNDVKVALDGGKLHINYVSNEVYLIGPAELVFEGKIDL